jgi:hypothetical protein
LFPELSKASMVIVVDSQKGNARGAEGVDAEKSQIWQAESLVAPNLNQNNRFPLVKVGQSGFEGVCTYFKDSAVDGVTKVKRWMNCRCKTTSESVLWHGLWCDSQTS